MLFDLIYYGSVILIGLAGGQYQTLHFVTQVPKLAQAKAMSY